MSYKNEENEIIEDQEQVPKVCWFSIQDSLCKGTCDLHIHTANSSDGTEVSSYLIKKVISHNSKFCHNRL